MIGNRTTHQNIGLSLFASSNAPQNMLPAGTILQPYVWNQASAPSRVNHFTHERCSAGSSRQRFFALGANTESPAARPRISAAIPHHPPLGDHGVESFGSAPHSGVLFTLEIFCPLARATRMAPLPHRAPPRLINSMNHCSVSRKDQPDCGHASNAIAMRNFFFFFCSPSKRATIDATRVTTIGLPRIRFFFLCNAATVQITVHGPQSARHASIPYFCPVWNVLNAMSRAVCTMPVPR